MAKDNEEVKATLLEGNTRFSSAATVMGNVKTELETLLTNLNWEGPVDQSAKEAYTQVRTQFVTDAGTAQDVLQKCAGALKSLHDAIVQAEEKAKQAKEQQDTEEVLILGVLTFAQAAAGLVTSMLIAADEASAATLEIIDEEVMQLPDVLQDVEAVENLPAVDEIPTLPVNDIPPPDAPPTVNTPPAGAPPVDAPDVPPPSAPPVDPPTTPAGGTPDAPDVPPPNTPEGQPPSTPKGQPPNTPEETPPAGNDTPGAGAEKRDSGVDFGTTEEPGKFADPSVNEPPKEIGPQDPVQVYTVHEVPEGPAGGSGSTGNAPNPNEPIVTETEGEKTTMYTNSDGSTVTYTRYLPGEPEETVSVISRDPDGIITSIRSVNPDGSMTVTVRNIDGTTSTTSYPPRTASGPIGNEPVPANEPATNTYTHVTKTDENGTITDVVTTTDEDGTTTTAVTTVDKDGNITETTTKADNAGNITETTSYPQGNTTVKQFDSSTGDIETTDKYIDPQTGNEVEVHTIKDTRGNVYANQIETIRDPHTGTVSKMTTKTSTDAAGNSTQTVTYPDGKVIEKVTKTSTDANGTVTETVTTTETDTAGHPIQQQVTTTTTTPGGDVYVSQQDYNIAPRPPGSTSSGEASPRAPGSGSSMFGTPSRSSGTPTPPPGPSSASGGGSLWTRWSQRPPDGPPEGPPPPKQ